MATQLGSRSGFAETFAIHAALKKALKASHFDRNESVQKAAEKVRRDLEAPRSIYGKQLQMLDLMANGATIAGLGQKLKCSRRTAFRYLNYLEEAGISIRLEDGKYFVDKDVIKMIND